ncbi:gentisate 1,2-dioxygenase [Streptomyces sp. NPDC058326]|uniref:gentisate 1,2-dioxygenase n=1 Tax=Streptomyces sp. NPDC058326 TaxID=3346447 RepID=UPI0036E4181E
MSLDAYYDRIGEHHLAALWTRLSHLITPQPRSDCRAHRWRYADVRPALLAAGEVITAEEAERRVLILENPGLPGSSKVTTSLYAGMQLVLPGEIAPSHRHSQSALRVIVEGSGAYSVVGGERVAMERGDLVLTRPMTWHDHGSEGDGPTIWLDALDIPLVGFFDASFLERSPEAARAVTRPDGDSLTRYGAALLPVGSRPGGNASPITSYPYARTREVLTRLAKTDAPDPWHGVKVAFTNPLTGGDVLPTMSAWAQLLPSGWHSAAYRSTDATVLLVIEGRGRTRIGDQVLDWEAGDVVVVPSWSWVRHEADEESVLMSYSDQAAQRALGLWREERRSDSPE